MRERSKKEFIEYAVVFGLAAVLARFGTPQLRRKLEIIVGFDEGDYAVVG